METDIDYLYDPVKKLEEVDNTLKDGLNKRFEFDEFKDISEFSEINPRIIFEENEMISLLQKQQEEEKERIRIMQEFNEQKVNEEIERKRLLKEEEDEHERIQMERNRLENLRKSKKQGFWDSVTIVVFVLLFIFFILIIST